MSAAGARASSSASKPRAAAPNRRGPDGARRAYSGAPWETKIGYCRALRMGAHVWVTGSAAVRADGGVFGRGDAQAQARRCLDVIEAALHDVGATMEQVVRTRIFVTDIDDWEAIGRAHHERFAAHPPATSMVEVSRLIHPDMLVEIEAEAYVPEGAAINGSGA